MNTELITLLILLAISGGLWYQSTVKIHSRIQAVRQTWTTVISDEDFLADAHLREVPAEFALNRKREIEDLWGLKNLHVLSPTMTIEEVINTLNSIHRVRCTIHSFPYFLSFAKLLCAEEETEEQVTPKQKLNELRDLTVAEFIELCFAAVPQMR